MTIAVPCEWVSSHRDHKGSSRLRRSYENAVDIWGYCRVFSEYHPTVDAHPVSNARILWGSTLAVM